MSDSWSIGSSANILLGEGIYEAKVQDLEKVETVYGERVRWAFWIDDHDVEVIGFSSLSPSGKAKPAKWARAILGLEKSQPVNWGPEELNGKPCRVYIDVNEDGDDNIVTKVLPPTDEQKRQAETGEVPF